MYSDSQLTDPLWRRKWVQRWGIRLVKGLESTRENLNCSRVIKLTMGLRLHLLKPLMLKTPTESNGVRIHLCIRKGNFLHNSFIRSTCNGSNHWSHVKEGKSWLIMSVRAAFAMENTNKKVGSLIRFLCLVGRKKFNSIAHLLERSYKWLNISLMLSVAIFLLRTCVRAWVMSFLSSPFLSVSLPSRVDDPDNIPEKRSYQGVLHLDLISTPRDWKK